MRLVLRSLPQMVVMAAIVTSALRAVVTFGSVLTALEGLLARWALLFLPALVYAACVMPWSARE
jgi:hypothetical protein